MAEFVDNSLQSYLTHREELAGAEENDQPLAVEIEIDSSEDGQIVVRDNAAGIYEHEYQRAFRPTEAPPDATGLSQFGMGMKSAACWFGRKLTVRSKALDEDVERVVTLDIDRILSERQERLPVIERPIQPAAHYTELVLERLYKPPQGRTLAKIKDHLASIYRVFLRDNVLTIRLKSATSDEHLAYHSASRCACGTTRQ